MNKTVEDKIKNMNTRELALYLHSFQAQEYEVCEIEELLIRSASVYEEQYDCGCCQNEDGCDNCIRADENEDKENPDFTDNYYHVGDVESEENHE